MTRAPQAHEHIDESAPALEISSVRNILAIMRCALWAIKGSCVDFGDASLQLIVEPNIVIIVK